MSLGKSLIGAAVLFCLAGTSVAAGPEDHEALARRFVSVLPASDEAAEPTRLDEGQAQRQADLVKANPGKADAVRAAFARRIACSDEKRDAMLPAMMLAIARSLSDEQLQSLIAFYTSPDFARLSALDGESAEAKALMARYPLEKFAEAMKAYATAHVIEDVMAAEQACDAELDEALAKTGVRP
ncbi:hypothetical protein [Sphingomonas sp.]|uniref:hypothetical protein n=1 Tax=Sphingomonas sp. TaxID=28214 RepID=UPI001AFDEAAC|nr:hypothetical protein [Sphingomonas sp.]MBO9712431.1 hypothetical protein [Sphingomonas sp.]